MTTRYVQVGQCTTDTDTVHTVSHQRYIHDSTGGEAPSLLHWWDPFTTPLAVTTPLAGPPSDSTGGTPFTTPLAGPPWAIDNKMPDLLP